MKKTRFYEAVDDGSYSHVEPVYLYDDWDDGIVGAGYFRKYSDAKKEIYEKLKRLAEDYRYAAASVRSQSKSVMLEEWDEYAKERAGLKIKEKKS